MVDTGQSATNNKDRQQWWTISNQQHGLAAITDTGQISNQQHGLAAMVDNQQPTTRIGSYCGQSAANNRDWQQWWTLDNQRPTRKISRNWGQWTISNQQHGLAAMVDTGHSATNNNDWQQ